MVNQLRGYEQAQVTLSLNLRQMWLQKKLWIASSPRNDGQLNIQHVIARRHDEAIRKKTV